MSALVYKTAKNPQPWALVIACGDTRFQGPLNNFIKDELGLVEGYFFPLIIPGGPAPFAHQEELPKDFDRIRWQVELILSLHRTIKTIVVFGHEDCGYYRKKLPGQEAENRELEDLPVIAEKIKKIFDKIRDIRIFYARFSKPDQGEVAFERIKEVACQPA